MRGLVNVDHIEGKYSMSRAISVIVALVLASGSVGSAQDLFITNARIVDPAAREILTGNLLIENGVIVGNPSVRPAGFTGQTIDVQGKWVIPGLNELHTHSYGNMAPGNVNDAPGTAAVARRMLYAGVTSFLDLFGDEETLFNVRRRQQDGELGGADLFTSLSCLTATSGHCTEYGVPTRTMDSPDEARGQVNALAEKAADVVKIIYAPQGGMPSIDKETFAAAVETANARGIKTVVHIESWQDVRDAVEVGASAVTHVPGQQRIPPDLARLMAERGVYSIPTLAVHTDFRNFVTDQSVLGHAMATRLTTQEILDAYRTQDVIDRVREWREEMDSVHANVMASVKAMSVAGVTILTGTDAGNWGTIQGYSVHRELELLVQAGLSEWQALAGSTTNAGEFLGQPFGVNDGDVANFVVLDASPVEDIRNTLGIVMVVHHGVVVDREAILATSRNPN